MGAMADPASLLGAAVRAACLAKAPWRTVQAVAAAVTAVLVKQEQDTPLESPGTGPREDSRSRYCSRCV